MVPDCIDPQERGFLREIMTKPIPEAVAEWQNNSNDLWESRLHWSGCPACRTEFAELLPYLKQMGLGVANKCRCHLSQLKDEYLLMKNSRLAKADEASAYAQIIVAWADVADEVFNFLIQGQEAPSLGASTGSRNEYEASHVGIRDPCLPKCQEYQEFISSLELDVQHFVFAVACCRDLLMPVWEEMSSVLKERWEQLNTVITNSELNSATLFLIIEKASIAYSISTGSWRGAAGGWPTVGFATGAQTDSPQKILTTQETKAFQAVREEWKRGFERLVDSLDSLKAGQMEILREYGSNRPAAAYEPFIATQLGEPLYSELHQVTQRALQLVEYYYNINREPDGFALFALRMAQGYENELNVRVIGPIVIELLRAGTQTYDAQGKSKEPLIRWGKENKRGMTLGSWAWYLRFDPSLRSKVSERGFDVEAISKDATSVNEVRRKAAHDITCDRTHADELRRQILRRDGILSRLHPMAATAADALTA